MANLDWMYKGVSGLVDKEEYLTGRRIDKTFEVIQSSENPAAKGDLDAFEPNIPGSVLGADGLSSSSMVTIDLAAKLREDPLYEIRVKQREQRKKLLDNPLKLKKLKTILESTLKDDTKHKKSKRKKKRRRDSSSSSSDDSASDSDHKSSRSKHRRPEDRSDRKRHHSEERRHHRSRESDRERYRRDRDSDRRDDRKYDQGLKKPKTDELHSAKRYVDKPTASSKPKRLSAEEMEKKRQEMVNNAVWREVHRKSNVKSYAEEEQKESEFNSTGKSAQFIKPLLKSATESDSLEERIKQKRFRSQRGHDTMDKNFARR